MKKYYSLLGLSQTATETEIRQAYRNLAFEYHPDRNPGNDDAVRKFREITEAYNAVLSKSIKRNNRQSGGLWTILSWIFLCFMRNSQKSYFYGSNLKQRRKSKSPQVNLYNIFILQDMA